MQIHHVGYRIRGFYRVAALGHLWDMTPKDAHRRLEILRFFDKHGLAATRDAFGASRRTLYRWKATLKAQGGNPAALAAQSSAPKRRRTPNTDPRLVSEIRRLRTLHPNLGKAKLHVLLEPWRAQHGIALPSVSIIGRIIARAPDKMRHAPARIDSRGRAKPLRRRALPRKPKQVKAQALEVLACDTIERIRDGMRRYIVTFIDPVSHFAFAVGLPSKHARYTARALEQGLSLLPPQSPTTVLSDNGSEFEADFAQLLEERGIKRWYTYPKTPKMNAHAERFNRTIQESFVDDHEELLFTDLALFSRKLADWLAFYNAERRTTPSASVPRYPSSCNINPSAKGTGLKQMFDPLLFWCHNMWLRFIGEQTSAQHKHLEWFGVWTTGPRLIWRVPRGATGTSWEYQHDPD